jgi:hypothetical protein
MGELEMSEKNQPGIVVGRASGLKVGSEKLDRSAAEGKPSEATKVKAVLFVHDKFDPEETLEDIEVVEVNAVTMQNIVERRT